MLTTKYQSKSVAILTSSAKQGTFKQKSSGSLGQRKLKIEITTPLNNLDTATDC